MVWPGRQFRYAFFDDRIRAVDLILLRGMFLYVLLDLFSCDGLRIQRASRHQRLCSRERMVVVNQVEPSAIDHQKASEFGIFRSLQ